MDDSPERKEEVEQALKCADNYALLLCLLEGTSIEIRKTPFTPENGNFPYNSGIYDKYSISHKERDAVYEAVVGIVKPEDQAAVLSFLSHPLNHPLNKTVHEVIDWRRA